MNESLTSESIQDIRSNSSAANLRFREVFPWDSTQRQPVHTVYGGAQLFSAATAKKMGEVALRSLEIYAPTPDRLAAALTGRDAVDDALWTTVYTRVVEKLKSEAVEDFRIDFEDGYGNRTDQEEDGHAAAAAQQLVEGMQSGTLPPFIGIRIKPFNEENIERAIRTTDIVISTMLQASGGNLPNNFVVTLPKITIAQQSRSLAMLLGMLERNHGLAKDTLKLELMVETPQAVLDSNGVAPLRSFVEAADGRCVGAHFGTYDYTAGCNITAAYQTMANPVCDFAKHVMQVTLAGSGVMLSDGATNVLPVGPNRAEAGGTLSTQQQAENEGIVHRAWQISYAHIRHSLETGYYQGWDLHPAQLPVRYAAMYAFFLESLPAASDRLEAFVNKAAQATLLGDVFDDAATGQGLLNFFLRGLSCGAITEDEAHATGLTLDEIRSRSFAKILDGRR